MLLPYPYTLQPNGIDYRFTTNAGVSYEAYFTDAEGYFVGASFAKEAVMFGLQVIDGKNSTVAGLDARIGMAATVTPILASSTVAGLDARIGVTVAAILATWLTDHPAGVVCYVCNPSDKRPHQRALRFDRMFRQNNVDNVYCKVDVSRPPLYASALLLNSEFARQEIEQAVRELADKF